MKKAPILKLFSLVALAGTGAFAAFTSKKAEIVQADPAPSTRTVYLKTTNWNYGDPWFSVYEYESETTSEEYFYYVDTNNWGTVKAYMWDDKGNNKWPGVATEKVGTIDTLDVFRVPVYSEGCSLIFNNGNGSQTGDITGKSGGYVYYYNHGEGPYAYAINGGSANWVKMTQVSYPGAIKDYYEATVHASGYSYIFVRNDPSKEELSWDSKWTQTYDLAGVPEGKNCYHPNTHDGDKNWGEWHYFCPTNDGHEYAVGTFGRDPWQVSSGVQFVDTPNPSEWKVTLPLKANDEFRFYINEYYDPCYDDNSKFVMKGESPVHAEKIGNNIVLPNDLVEGAYTVYWSAHTENWGLYIVASEDTAVSLGLYIMQSDAPGQCETKFAKAKTRFLAMTDADEIAAFKASAAAERYEAWAASLKQKPYEEGAVSGAPYVGENADSNNLIMIVSIVSLISASTLVGLIVIKRRRGIAK